MGARALERAIARGEARRGSMEAGVERKNQAWLPTPVRCAWSIHRNIKLFGLKIIAGVSVQNRCLNRIGNRMEKTFQAVYIKIMYDVCDDDAARSLSKYIQICDLL